MDTDELVDQHPTSPSGPSRPIAATRRIRIAEALAFVGLLAAFVAALGPAERVRTTYAWPPPSLPEKTPSTVWYTPLLLSARIPEKLSATLPCRPAPALRSASNPHTILSTARSPERFGGLAVRRNGNRLNLTVGDRLLASLPVPTRPASADGCKYRLLVANGGWSIEGGTRDMTLGGDLGFMPVVNGVFSELDLREGTAPHIEVTTTAHATRTTPRQTIGWIVAALATLAALLLVGLEKKPSRPRHLWQRISNVVAAARRADGVVVAALLGWWVLAPTQWDDGWVLARQSGFAVTRGFSNYYDSLGTNLPNGYWLEWVQHWATQSSSALLVLRLPALICLVATWVLCRWLFGRVAASVGGAGRLPLWALTSAFLAGAMAWGMTLRPEPMTALLVTAVMACAVRFVERETVAPLGVAAVLIPLAVAGHHAGIVAVAPLLAIAPRLLRWTRANFPVAVTLGTASFAVLFALAVVGADLGQRSADAYAIQEYGIPRAWYNEFQRYAFLSEVQAGTPLRRGSVALMGLAVLAFALRRRRERRVLLDIPATTLALTLLLLLAVPSKWPWHFGALLGVACISVAAETTRLREDATVSNGWSARPLLGVGGVVVTIAWAWGPREIWAILDLRTLDWRPGFEEHLSLSVLAAALPLVLLGLIAGLGRFRGRSRARRAPWCVAYLTAPLLVIPLIAFTVAMFVIDTAKTDSWSVARQNLQTIRGDPGCGLAEDPAIPVQASMRPLTPAGATSLRRTPVWVPPAPLEKLPRLALGPTGGESATSPWFGLPSTGHIGLFVAGALSANDTLSVDFGRLSDGRVERLGQSVLSVDQASGDLGLSAWRFVTLTEADLVEAGANAIRVRLESDVGPGAAIAVTTPVSYANETFARLLSREEPRMLVSPGLLTYFPCARQPRLKDGVAEVPDYVVAATSLWQRCPCAVGYTTSPFFGLHDVYQSTKLTWTDPHDTMRDVAIYRVERRIPGGRLIPAVMASTS